MKIRKASKLKNYHNIFNQEEEIKNQLMCQKLNS